MDRLVRWATRISLIGVVLRYLTLAAVLGLAGGGSIVIWAAATVVRAIDDAGQDETSEDRPAA